MKHPFIVTKAAMRPASDEEQCFYCKQTIGETHKPDCVLIMKRVSIRMIIEYPIVVPGYWDKEMIEFHRNESSWCADNVVDELSNAVDGEGGCLCNCARFECTGGETEPFLAEEGS